MRDLSGNWPAPPDWTMAEHHRQDLHVRTLSGLSQHLVSGDLDACGELDGAIGTGVGALGHVTGDRYALRLARDRMLVVNGKPELTRGGWHAAGFAVSDVSAAYHVFEMTGPRIDLLLSEAIAIDPSNGGPSASVAFAGQAGILYRHGEAGTIRLHVERGFATAVWTWLEARA